MGTVGFSGEKWRSFILTFAGLGSEFLNILKTQYLSDSKRLLSTTNVCSKPENIEKEGFEASSSQDAEFCYFFVVRRNPELVSSTVFSLKAPTIVFTLTKTSSQFVLELLSSKVEAHFDKILSKKQEKELTQISDLELRALCKKISVLEDKPLWIDDTEFQSVTELCEKCRQMKKEHQIGVVIIDDYYI